MEDWYIIDSFIKNFAGIKGKKVLYGTGQYTKLLLEELTDFNIIGVMDSKRKSGIFNGFPILDEYGIVQSSCNIIIIIANLCSAVIIYERIKAFAKSQGIRVFYMNGLQPEEYNEKIAMHSYWEKDFTQLYSRLDYYDIFSFDLFDTLIMRKCIFPHRIFDLINDIISKEGWHIDDFSKKRCLIEKDLYHNVTEWYRLTDIYCAFKQKYKFTEADAAKLQELEFKIEYDMILPRQDVVDFYNFLKSIGKRTIVVSDMYLSSEEITVLLDRCGIASAEIYVSNECKASKYKGDLFDYIKNIFNGKRIIHFGDSQVSDICNAEKKGIDTFFVANAVTLMDYYELDLVKYGLRSNDAILYEMFASKCFAAAFLRNKISGKIYIDDREEFGYLFFGSLAVGYLAWLIEQIRLFKIEYVLFAARDGYFFYQIYEELRKREEYYDLPEACYFFASRKAASVASIYSAEDAEFVFSSLCNRTDISVREVLKDYYGVVLEDDDTKCECSVGSLGKNLTWRYIKGLYLDRILCHAEEERRKYQSYINSLGILEKSNVAMMNFVGSGFTQRCIQKVLQRGLYGLYVGVQYNFEDILGKEFGGQIFSWYPEKISLHTSRCKLAQLCLYGEVIFSAPHGSVLGFDNGMPIYDVTSDNRVRFTEQIQKGIYEFFVDCLKRDSNFFNKQIASEDADAILGLIKDPRFVFGKGLDDFIFEDSYREQREERLAI